MKVKHLKRTLKVLNKFIKEVNKRDPEVMLDMRVAHKCAFYAVANTLWSSQEVDKLFRLVSNKGRTLLSPKMYDSVVELFRCSEGNFPEPNRTTWREWLVVAEVTRCQLKLEIAKANFKEMHLVHVSK